jgi:tetratricopeptide (TPR) repeat protein
MKRSSPIIVALLVTVYLSLTGFQCGSAEATSARLYMSQKQYDKAEDALVKQVAKNPDDEEAWFLLGQVRVELKKYVEANQAYDKALSISDVHKKEIMSNKVAFWGRMLNEGIESFKRGTAMPASYDTAITKFDNAISFQPDSAYTYYALSLAQSAKNEDAKAISSLEMALLKKPNFPEAIQRLGKIHRDMAEEKKGKDEVGRKAELVKASEVFEAGHRADPEKVEYISQLIDIYSSLGKDDKALALTRDAVAADPQNRNFRYVYGVFFLKQDKFAEGIDQLKMVSPIESGGEDPIFADAVYNLGVAYLNWGVAMKKDAEAQAEKAAKEKKKDFKEDLSFKEKFKAAIPYFEKATEIKKDDPIIWQQLGRLYTTLNMPDKANAAFKKFDAMNK